jgi:hypothetical protein
VRTTVICLVGAIALAVGTAPASAKTNECNGLQTCVPVAGPWVVVPIAGGPTRPRVEYQLACPARFVVGGLDVEVSERAIDVVFLGRSGSPVNPGITTESAAVFVGTYVGTGAVVASFRPHLGCIPASGGGARVPTVVRVFPVGKPVIRRSRDVPLRPGGRRVVAERCLAGEQLVGSSDAVGFYGSTPPASRLVSSVALGARITKGKAVQVVVRVGDAVRGTRAVVQVVAVCAGGA